MPTLVDEEDVKPPPADDTSLAGDGALSDAPPTPAPPVPPSTGKSTGKSGKRRPSISSTPESAAANNANQAIAAANLAAAVQMAASLQLNGLLSLLTQSSTPGAASVVDPTILQANLPVPKLNLNASWQIPSPEQVRQAALKAASDIPPFVHLSKNDSAFGLKIMDDRLTLRGGMRGYRMSRATHGVSQGHYYFEVLVLEPPTIQEIVHSLPPNARLPTVLQTQIQQALEHAKRQRQQQSGIVPNAVESSIVEPPPAAASTPGRKRKAAEPPASEPPPPPQVGGHLRIGWSMRTGELQAPVGYDKWSYGFRNLQGSKIHQSRREDHWGGEPWGAGDVVGCAIFLNGPTGAATATPAASNVPAGTTAAATTVNGNEIRFFKNGAAMGHFVISKGKREGGAAFEDVQPGTYYPAISSYLGGSVQVNFGPHFVHPPRKLPHGMSGKLQPISSLQPPPLTDDELLGRLKKKNVFAKVGKETPDAKMAAFREAVLAEAKVMQDAYKQHRLKHLKFVLDARQARNLSITELQQELDELGGEEKDGEEEGDDAMLEETAVKKEVAAEETPIKEEEPTDKMEP